MIMALARRLRGPLHLTENGASQCLKMDYIDQDCKYYYTSSCMDRTCPFRHEPEALGSYVVCSFWKKKNCRKKHCQYRHMELRRDEIPCYWETQPSGCEKDDCPFRHSNPKRNTNWRAERVQGGARNNPRQGGERQNPRQGGERQNPHQGVERQNSRQGGERNNPRQGGEWQNPRQGVERQNPRRDVERQNPRSQSTPRHSNTPTHRAQAPTGGAAVRSQSQDNKKGEKKLKKKLKEMERKLKEKDEERERELKKHQEELDAQASFTLQTLQDELEASVNASTTCMSATEDIIRHVGSTMREEFECKICFELFISPMTLNCSHSFCDYCINKWRLHSRGCPSCRQNITTQSRALAIENFIERMVSNLTEEMRERRKKLIEGRLN